MNPDDLTHRMFAELLETSTGIGNRPIKERSFTGTLKALRTADLRIIHYEDLAESSGQAVVPWYSILDSAFSKDTMRWPNTIGEQGEFGDLTKDSAMVLSRAGHDHVS